MAPGKTGVIGRTSAARAASADVGKRTKDAAAAVIGRFSMGGLLSIELARRYPAAPTFARQICRWCGLYRFCHRRCGLRRGKRAIVRLADSGLRGLAVAKLAGRDLFRPRSLAKRRCVRGDADAGTGQPGSADARTVRTTFPDVLQPALLAHGQLDHTVPVACVDALADELGTLAEHKTNWCFRARTTSCRWM